VPELRTARENARFEIGSQHGREIGSQHGRNSHQIGVLVMPTIMVTACLSPKVRVTSARLAVIASARTLAPITGIRKVQQSCELFAFFT
jgi:hypothetical protein